MFTEEIFKFPQQIFERWTFRKGFALPEYTTTTIPLASTQRGVIVFVTDAVAGTQFRASDGTSWRTIG